MCLGLTLCVLALLGYLSLRSDPSRALGELIHDEGSPLTEFEADLPGEHVGVLEWVTTEFETEEPSAAMVLASIEVRLLAPDLRRR